jgi:hypothetical protein
LQWLWTNEIWWKGIKVSHEPAASIYSPILKIEAPKYWYLPTSGIFVNCQHIVSYRTCICVRYPMPAFKTTINIIPAVHTSPSEVHMTVWPLVVPTFIRICQLYLVTEVDKYKWTWYHENVLVYKSKSKNNFPSLTYLPGIPAAHLSSWHSLKERLSQGPSLTRHAKLSMPPETDTNVKLPQIPQLNY